MKIEETALSEVKLIIPRRFGDHRGFFAETYNKKVFGELGIDIEFVQDNHSLSAQAGTIRGLHFQVPPAAQAKLVRCGRGAIFDVAVDIRKGSPTFGKWTGHELSTENGAQLFIPAGFAHGFVTLHADSEIIYKCSQFYSPHHEGAIRWNDPDIAIDWPLVGDAILSQRDGEAPLLGNFDSPFVWEG